MILQPEKYILLPSQLETITIDIDNNNILNEIEKINNDNYPYLKYVYIGIQELPSKILLKYIILRGEPILSETFDYTLFEIAKGNKTFKNLTEIPFTYLFGDLYLNNFTIKIYGNYQFSLIYKENINVDIITKEEEERTIIFKDILIKPEDWTINLVSLPSNSSYYINFETSFVNIKTKIYETL